MHPKACQPAPKPTAPPQQPPQRLLHLTHQGWPLCHPLPLPAVGDGKLQHAREPASTLPLGTPEPRVPARDDLETWMGFVQAGFCPYGYSHGPGGGSIPLRPPHGPMRPLLDPVKSVIRPLTEEAKSSKPRKQANRRRTEVMATYFSCLALSFFGLQW